MRHFQSQLAYWKQMVFTLLFLVPRTVLTAGVIFGAVLVSGLAYAGPTCPRVLFRSDEGATVLIAEGCQLDTVARMFPQIDPATGLPYPMQVQLRSIYAANQGRTENDGSYRRRTVLRTCAKPGKPDPHADAEEKTVCPKGLMYYFGVASDGGQAKIFIPSQRVLTSAESVEKLEHEMAAADALRNKELADRQAANDARERIQVDAQSAAKIARLEKDVSESRRVAAALKGPASKGRWFWPLIVCMFGLVAWGVGGTISTLRARQVKPNIATGRFFPSDEIASEVLGEENLSVKLENDKLRSELKSTRKSQGDEHRSFMAKLESLERSLSEHTLLSEIRIAERDEARSERDALRLELDRVQDIAIALRQESECQTEINERLQSDVNGLRVLSGMQEAENSKLEYRLQQFAISDREYRQLVAEDIAALEDVRRQQVERLQKLHVELESVRSKATQLEVEKSALMYERDEAISAQQAVQSRLESMQIRAVFETDDIVSADSDMQDRPTLVRKDTMPFGVRHLPPSSVNYQGASTSTNTPIPPYVGRGSSSSVKRSQTANGLSAIKQDDLPEEQFAALYQEITNLRAERDVYVQGFGSITTIVYGDPVPTSIIGLKPSVLVRLLIDDVKEVFKRSGRLPPVCGLVP